MALRHPIGRLFSPRTGPRNCEPSPAPSPWQGCVSQGGPGVACRLLYLKGPKPGGAQGCLNHRLGIDIGVCVTEAPLWGHIG